MKALLARVQDKFASLQQREKLFVCGGAAAVLLALLLDDECRHRAEAAALGVLGHTFVPRQNHVRNQPEFRQRLMLSVMRDLRRIRLFKIRASEFTSYAP